MYRLEHLAFTSNMEEQMAGWIEHPWHEEKGKRLVASIDHSLYGTRRSQTVAILDQAIAGPIVLETRPLALKHLREALQDNPNWQPKYRHGPRIN